MSDELTRRRDECIQLRTLLATRSAGLGGAAPMSMSGSETSGGGGGDSSALMNEDGELEMAYKTQKDLNK